MTPTLAFFFSGTFFLFALGVGLSIVAGLLLRPKGGGGNLGEDTPTTLATRGSYVPLLIGKRKIGHVFGWAGFRRSIQRSSGGKKKGGGGSQTVWFESGWHLLCAGAATGLYEIRANNKVIWSGTMTSDTTPSGTTTTIANVGSFTIFWGELDQQPYDLLVQGTGIRSGWPGLCYIYWRDYELGGSPTWPTLEYTVKALCLSQTLEDSNREITDGTSEGFNPAHLAFVLLRGGFPYGAGLALDDIDETTIESFGELMESEHLPMHLLGESGVAVSELMQSLLADAGAFLVQHDNRLLVEAMRAPTENTPFLIDDVITPPDAGRQVWRGHKTTNRLIFSFLNEIENYRSFDIQSQDAADLEARNASVPEEIEMGFITHPVVAKQVANRREQENLSQTIAVRFTVLRGAALLRAGKIFRHSFGQMRVLSAKPVHDSPRVEIEAIVDVYSVPSIEDVQDTPLATVLFDVENDLAFSFFQLPPEDTTSVAIVVFRIPAHSEIRSGSIYGSIDAGTNFRFIGQQVAGAGGGQIKSAIGASTDDIIVTGPIFEDANGLLDFVASDLTGDDAGWQAGTQVALINEEVFYVKSVSVQSETSWVASTAKSLTDFVIPLVSNGFRYECTTAGTTDTVEPIWPRKVGDTVTDGTAVWTCAGRRYQLNDMIRARKGTTAAAHAINDWVYLIAQDSLQPITDPLVAAGNTLCIKSVPETNNEIADISTITQVCKLLDSVDGSTLLATDTGDIIVTHLGEKIAIS